jgi:hypothetical protein
MGWAGVRLHDRLRAGYDFEHHARRECYGPGRIGRAAGGGGRRSNQHGARADDRPSQHESDASAAIGCGHRRRQRGADSGERRSGRSAADQTTRRRRSGERRGYD